jgi:hypothetical protein
MPRTRLALAFLATILLLLAVPAGASHPRNSSGGQHRSYSTHRTHAYRSPSHHTRKYAYGVPRDKYGHIKRSSVAKKKFERETGYPHGRPGYVVDHIIPLSEGGRDDPSNMQWQTKEEAKAKDRTERKH